MRRLQVFQLFENGKIDVLMLQETHANQSSEAEWRRIFKGCHLFSSALEEAKAGVAVVLHPRLQPLEIVYREVCKGFLISVDFISSNQNISIINVYCPSDCSERTSFLYKLSDFLSSIDFTSLVCMGGDYNCTLKAEVTFAVRRGYGGRTPSELTETCGGRSVSEVASGWPYIVWLYFTGRRGTMEL